MPAIEKPKPMMPRTIGTVLFAEIRTRKKTTIPIPITGRRFSFFTLVDTKAVRSLPHRIMTYCKGCMEAVQGPSLAGCNLINLGVTVIAGGTSCNSCCKESKGQ